MHRMLDLNELQDGDVLHMKDGSSIRIWKRYKEATSCRVAVVFESPGMKKRLFASNGKFAFVEYPFVRYICHESEQIVGQDLIGHDDFGVKLKNPITFLGMASYTTMHVRALRDVNNEDALETVTLFSADPDSSKLLEERVPASHYTIDCSDATVERKPHALRKFNVKGLTKKDVMAYLLLVNGPMVRLELMRQVARVEGKVFVPTSNSDYFSNKYGSAVSDDTICVLRKRGQASVYTFGDEGIVRAVRAIAQLGESAADYAKQK